MTGSGHTVYLTVTGSSVTHGLTGGIPAWFPLQPVQTCSPGGTVEESAGTARPRHVPTALAADIVSHLLCQI